MRTVVLLILSNIFMTYAWYGHLNKDVSAKPLIVLILISWGIAFFEYCFQVPANNIYGKKEGFSAFQLKTVQEVISLVVFGIFAVTYLKEPLRWNYLVAFILLCGAVFFMFYRSPK